ncbi:methyl-accepting chemotaxis protein [Pseudomonas guariconensis]|nr:MULTISPECIES: PAS domain-containing methyl-accepting chemotaxis protein [Pseudomonas]MCO7637310.1 methyl-accepting chemotaxis protein [Pseudomonas sp. S 311-6]MCO7517036.1 methyl-accepting chemotaxis protein [Pseudomonas putida]MCO7566953.1 methyl-accepting chemotaxis protein [Pseudomonas mosselii]MCO7592839.1 methyl-accepting chemotaxis protein [Pseudomonas guariconensis]MCO7607415.1 methyl-accepting chemotaxis protein [Pseudomonas guariconensis]
MKCNMPVTGRQVDYPGDANILSTTDLDSLITYANDDFVRISGFTRDELLGNAHHIVRHPDMPSQAFEQMWQALKGGRSWMGLVKNRCKNGDHYWVSAFVSPISSGGKTIEYQSVRTRPSVEQVAAAERCYARLREGRRHWCERLPVLGLGMRLSFGVAAIVALVLGAGQWWQGAPWLPTLLEVVLAAGLSSALILMLLRPFERLRRQALAIADNPLSQQLYTGRRDGVGQIEFAMRMLKAQLGAVVGRIGDTSARLAGHSGALVDALQASHANSLEQQDEADQVATAIHQMSASVAQVASSAQLASMAADQAEGETQSGHQLVDRNRCAIQDLAGSLVEASEVVRQLENHSSEISGVLDVIRGIAEQTNLLALNAAIEAARAGDQGRGFAVVADEVRGLAQRTAQSTHQIQRMIATLQEGARAAVQVMQQSSAHAGHSVEQAQLASGALDSISARVNQINEMSLQIAAAVEQQSRVSESINRNIVIIRQASEATVDVGQRSHSSASDVADLAQDLRRLADEFWRRCQ